MPAPSTEVIEALRECLRGYYNRISSRTDYTREDILAIIEEDFKTLREWDGENIIDQLIKP